MPAELLRSCALLVVSLAILFSAASACASASDPSPRGDEKSQKAHEQLVSKARAGKIDLYFLGDSITRRWGCSDPKYKSFLENWKKNFFGWNAGNFGWGGDLVQNILWRVQNGELHGVNPKVIVILAGTNNVGARPGGPDKVADISKGLAALVASCRGDAPGAKIIVMGIFPRNNRGPEALAVIPEIAAINEKLRGLADGREIFFVDIGDKLAGPDGTLFKGMTVDGLHLSEKGYQIWANALAPLLERLMGPRAGTDLAPPPTGDPSVKPPSGS